MLLERKPCSTSGLHQKSPKRQSPPSSRRRSRASRGRCAPAKAKASHILQRKDKQHIYRLRQPLSFEFHCWGKRKKKKPKSNPGIELQLLGPSLPRSLAGSPFPSLPGAGAAQVTELQPHSSLGIPYCNLTTGQPPLQHICTTSGVRECHP